MNRSNKRKWFHTKKQSKTPRSRRYPTKIMTDTDYANDLALLANTPDET